MDDRPWVEAVVAGVTKLFEARQAKREADKARNRQIAQEKADMALFEKQASFAKPQDFWTQAQSAITSGSGFTQFMPLLVIVGIVVFGAVLLKR